MGGKSSKQAGINAVDMLDPTGEFQLGFSVKTAPGENR
jgi:hypothetical protein